MSPPLNFNSKCVFPQIDHIVSLKDVEYMSIGKVLFDIKKYVSIMAHGYDTEDTLIYFYNFNGFLSILDKFTQKLINHDKYTNRIRKLILFTVIEGDEVAIDETEKYKRLIDRFDVIICPVSIYTNEIISKWFEKHNIKQRLLYVPHGIDKRIFNNCDILNQDLSKLNGFKFLYVGNNSYRKNVSAIVNAFKKEFKDDENIKLILKINNIIGLDIEDNKNIIVISDVDEFVLSDVYRTVDCCVFATRCEGFGLPILESLMCGTPVISPYHSGLKSMFPKSEIISVNHTEEEIPEKYRHEISNGKGKWYNVDEDDLASKMRETVKNNPKKTEKFKKFTEMLRNDFNYMEHYGVLFNDIGRKTKHYLEHYYGKKYDLASRISGNIINDRDNTLLKLVRHFEGKHQEKLRILYNNQNSKLDFLKNYFEVKFEFAEEEYHSQCEKVIDDNCNKFDIIYLDYGKPDFNSGVVPAANVLKCIAATLYNINREIIVCMDHNLSVRNKVFGNGEFVYELFDSLFMKPFSRDYVVSYKLNKKKEIIP